MGQEVGVVVVPLADYGKRLSQQNINSKQITQEELDGNGSRATAIGGRFNTKGNRLENKSDQVEWEKPIFFNDYALPIFPIEVLPDWMGVFCNDVAKSMKTPIDLAGCMCLSALSLAVTKKYKVKVKEGHVEHLNIWTLTLLEPSNLKSPVTRAMVDPIRAYEKRQNELERVEIAEAREMRNIKERQLESLKTVASKPKKEGESPVDYIEIKRLAVELEEEEIPKATQMLISDITTEQLITTCYEQKGNRIGALTGEGRVVFDNWTKYGSGSTNFNFYLSAYSNEYYSVDRRGRHEVMEEPALVMGLATQRDVLTSIDKKLFNKLNDSGLLARFLYSYPLSLIGGRDFSVDHEIPVTSSGNYSFNLAGLLSIPMPDECYLLTLSSEAKEFYIKYRQQLENDLKEGGSLENYHSYGGKAHGQLIRVTGLLHIAENVKHPRLWEVKISGETIQRAILLMNYFQSHMLAVFSLIGSVVEEVPAKKILKYIQGFKKDIIDRRTLQQNFKNTNGLKSKKELDEAIGLLEEWGHITKEFDTERGKKKTIYRINPLSQNAQNPQYAVKSDNTRGSSVEVFSPIHPQSIPIKENKTLNNIMPDKWGASGELTGSNIKTCEISNGKGLEVIGDNGDFGLKVKSQEANKQEDFSLLEGEI